jgi:hypothetical protein
MTDEEETLLIHQEIIKDRSRSAGMTGVRENENKMDFLSV